MTIWTLWDVEDAVPYINVIRNREYPTWVKAWVRYYYLAVNILPVYVKNNARGLMPPIA